MIILTSISRVIGDGYLLPTKKQKEYTISVGLAALVDVLLNILLIRYYQSIGAAIATLVAKVVVCFSQLYLVKKEITIKRIASLSYKYLIASIIMFIVSLAIGRFITKSYLYIISEVLISIIVYFVMLYILKCDFLIAITKKLRKSV